MRRSLAAFLLLAATAAVADPAKYSGSIRVRAENWRFFETPGFDDTYTFVGVLLRGSAAKRWTPAFHGQLELVAPALLSLPDRAVAPAPRGQLGFGGSYFAANDNEENAASLGIRQAWLRYTRDDLTLRFGRFELIDGAEVAPKDPVIAELKRTRIAHRLLGNFGFSHVGRGVDGVQVTWQAAPSTHLLATAVRPTAGALDVDTNEQLDVDVLYAALTQSAATSDMRLFAIGYRDRRDVVKTDNRPAPTRAGDTENIEIATIGGHLIQRFGAFDVVLWGALQRGDWGAIDHHASALDVEGGWRSGITTIRAGTFRGSGDGDPLDGEHGTFFQILPTPRIYARFPFYNLMNSRDDFVQLIVKPTKALTVTTELHNLGLTERRDLWYAGAGAGDDRSFGFAGRPSVGRNGLARVIDLSADWTVSPKTSITAYAAFARGEDVVQSIFDGDGGRLFYLEVTRRF